MFGQKRRQKRNILGADFYRQVPPVPTLCDRFEIKREKPDRLGHGLDVKITGNSDNIPPSIAASDP